MSSEPLLTALPGHNSDQPCSFEFHPAKENFFLPQLSVIRKKELVAAETRAWRQTWILKWARQKAMDPFVLILQRGLEPKVLSLSAAVGLTIGLFPICGVAMILCALSAVVLRSKCHVPTLMLGNLVASIFELGLLVPFIRVGELVTRGDHFIITSTGLWEALTGRSEPTHELVFGMLHAVLGWSIVAPFSIVILFVGFLPMFHYLTARFGSQKLDSHQASGCCDAASEAGEPTSNAYPTIINFAETKN